MTPLSVQSTVPSCLVTLSLAMSCFYPLHNRWLQPGEEETVAWCISWWSVACNPILPVFLEVLSSSSSQPFGLVWTGSKPGPSSASLVVSLGFSFPRLAGVALFFAVSPACLLLPSLGVVLHGILRKGQR